MPDTNLNQLVKLALEIRALHKRCQELSEFMRRETSWINQTGTAHQLRNYHEQWLAKLYAYWRLSAEYAPKCPEEEVWTIVYLDKLVEEYDQAR